MFVLRNVQQLALLGNFEPRKPGSITLCDLIENLIVFGK